VPAARCFWSMRSNWYFHIVGVIRLGCAGHGSPAASGVEHAADCPARAGARARGEHRAAARASAIPRTTDTSLTVRSGARFLARRFGHSDFQDGDARSDRIAAPPSGARRRRPPFSADEWRMSSSTQSAAGKEKRVPSSQVMCTWPSSMRVVMTSESIGTITRSLREEQTSGRTLDVAEVDDIAVTADRPSMRTDTR